MSGFEEFDWVVDDTPELRDFDVFSKSLGFPAFIEAIRVPATGPLDIEATALKLGLPVSFDENIIAKAEITGLGHFPKEPLEIKISTSDDEPAMSFGHEVGHYALNLVELHHVYDIDIEEAFCEYFGRQLSMPNVDHLTIETLDGAELTQLCDEYKIRISTLLYWLMEKQVLPKQIIVDSRLPDVPNKAYAYKIVRNIVCIECEHGHCNGSVIENPEDTMPILNLTSLEIGNTFSVGHTNGLTHYEDPAFKALQEKYA